MLEIRPSKDTGDEGRLGRLGHQQYHHRDKLQCYVKLRMIDTDKFKCSDLFTINMMMGQLRLNGIVSFEIAGECFDDGIMMQEVLFPEILPNLQEINLSNTSTGF